MSFLDSLFGVSSAAQHRRGGQNTMQHTTARRAEPAAIRINKDINLALESAAKDFKVTRASIVKNALLEYLEDMADSKAIAEAKKQGGKNVSFSELRKELGL
ncbi:MAG: DUF6290 family protein [Sideroxydans sp.]|nr:DUF6290 family protein [Sideroxydans sp.]